MKKSKAAPLVRVSVLCAYVKRVSGRMSLEGESLLEHAANCLVSQGAIRNGMNARRFIEANRSMIVGGGKPASVAAPVVVRDERADKAFLNSYEWRVLRMRAIKKYGARCQCCGATPADGIVINVDHIKPRKLFPELALDIDNLQVLCSPCNHGKSNWDMTDWRQVDTVP